MLKDLFYLGLGGALLAKEKVAEELDKLIEKGKVSKEDVQNIIEQAKKKGEEEEKRARRELKKLLKEVVREMDLATKKDIEELKRLLEK